MTLDKTITIRVSDEQIEIMDTFCKTYHLDRAGLIRSFIESLEIPEVKTLKPKDELYSVIEIRNTEEFPESDPRYLIGKECTYCIDPEANWTDKYTIRARVEDFHIRIEDKFPYDCEFLLSLSVADKKNLNGIDESILFDMLDGVTLDSVLFD